MFMNFKSIGIVVTLVLTMFMVNRKLNYLISDAHYKN